MMIATTTWLIDKTTFVAVLASLVMGRAKEAMRPVIASATKYNRGRLVHRRHAAASAVPATHSGRAAEITCTRRSLMITVRRPTPVPEILVGFLGEPRTPRTPRTASDRLAQRGVRSRQDDPG